MLLEEDAFLTQLSRFYVKSKQDKKGSVITSMKRFIPREKKERTNQKFDKKSSKKGSNKKDAMKVEKVAKPRDLEPHCLVHARLDKKKISVVIKAKDAARFHVALGQVWSVCLDSMEQVAEVKKKEVKKKEAKKETKKEEVTKKASTPAPKDAKKK